MPYKIIKSGSGFKVSGPEGAKYSKHPQSRAKATAQMRAMYANTRGENFNHGATSHR